VYKPRTSLVVLLSLLVLSVSLPLTAEDTGEEDLTRAVIEAKKKIIVSAVMQLSKEEGDAFWPIYHSYQAELDKLSDRQADLVDDYLDHYRGLSDEKAQDLMDELLAIETQSLKLKKSYVKKFKKVLPASKVARYFQTENKMDAVIRYEIATLIPMVE
jgi:hypothetical protein